MDTIERVELERLPGFALAQAFRLLRHAMDDALREVGLTTPQWGLLMCGQEHDGISGAEMARLHHLTPQTVHTILTHLEDDGLVVRERHPSHGTLLRVRLTQAGFDRLEEATRRVRTVHERMLSDLNAGERAVLMSLLGRCATALERDGTRLSEELPCIDG